MERKEEVKKVVRIRSTLDFQLRPSDKEVGGGVSMTVPDESLSVRNIIDRFTRGQGSGVAVREGYYDPSPDLDSPDIDKLDHMDLIDRDEFAEVNRATKERLEKEIADDKKRKAEEKKKRDEEDEQMRAKFRSEKEPKSKSDEKPKG